MPRHCKVLSILGPGRSGTTILGNILGEVPGFFAAGEVRFVWQRGLIERRPCGCGMPVPDCSVWSAVLRRLAVTGTFVTDDVLVNTYTAGQQANPAVTVLGNGNIVVIWSSFGQDGSRDQERTQHDQGIDRIQQHVTPDDPRR